MSRRGSVEVVRDGSLCRVTIMGGVDATHFAVIISRVVELEAEYPMSSMLIDFGPAERIDLTEEELFHVVASMRRRLRRTAEHRFALVAPAEPQIRFVNDFVGVRDLLAGEVEGPAIRLFAARAEAEAWLREPPE